MLRRFALALAVAVGLLGMAREARAIGVIDEFDALVSESPRERSYPVRVGESSLYPRSRIVLGRAVQVHPFAGQWLGYDNNINFVDEDDPDQNRAASGFSRTEFGTRLETILRNDHRLSATYRGRHETYFTEPDFDFLQHAGELEAEFNFPRWYARGRARVVHSNDPLLIDVPQRVTYTTSTARAWGGYVFSKFGVAAGVEWFDLDYEGAAFRRLDHFATTAVVQGNFRQSEKLKLLAEYRFTVVRFDRPILNDFDTHQQLVGVVGEVTPKITVSAKGGVMVQRVRSTGTNPDDEDFSGISAEVELRWRPAEDTRFTLRYRRRVDPSLVSNFLEHDVLFAEMEHFLTRAWIVRGNLQADWGNPSQGFSLFRFVGRAEVEYRIREWARATAGASFSLLDTRAPNAEYENARARAGLVIAF